LDLSGANLQDADLRCLEREGKDPLCTDLREAKNLTVEQLSTVRTLYGAQLDSLLEEKIQQQYRYLLEKPQDQEEKP
jgi:hypothetical protein